jgi:hypothetical protein
MRCPLGSWVLPIQSFPSSSLSFSLYFLYIHVSTRLYTTTLIMDPQTHLAAAKIINEWDSLSNAGRWSLAHERVLDDQDELMLDSDSFEEEVNQYMAWWQAEVESYRPLLQLLLPRRLPIYRLTPSQLQLPVRQPLLRLSSLQLQLPSQLILHKQTPRQQDLAPSEPGANNSGIVAQRSRQRKQRVDQHQNVCITQMSRMRS